MSSTSDQTTKPSKTRLIVGEIGIDTETGIVGKGHSYDNGKTFTVDDTIYGRIYHADDHDKIWKGIQDQVAKVVDPAKSAADSAANAADAAVASAQVTSNAVSAIASATAEAKQGMNEAMSRAESAWDVATGAKSAVTDFDPLLKQAQSDAGEALTQVAATANALSDAKTAFSSDVAAAKGLANTAQATADSAVESASENARALTSQANALSDTKKAMDSDVASAKGLAIAAQSTADSAIESASSVASDLTAVASQAKANASGITKVTSDVGLLQTTVADNSGNISTIQETAKQIQQAVSDNSGNIMVAKQTADSAVSVASDAKSNATVAVQTASGASVTAENAQSNATTAMVTASGAVTQASDAKSNATIAVQTASEASVTATNAQGDASIAKQTASDVSVQIKNAQGDISKLQTQAGKIEASVATNSGAIADVQATANQLKASVSDNSGNIMVATQTAQSAVSVASDASSNATVASQTASQASVTAQNASGQAASAVVTANGAMTTASNAKSDATVAIQTASGASLTATNAQGDASIAKQTASAATVQVANAESDFAQLSIRANKIEANVATNSGAIASVQQTANGLTTTVANIKANGGGVNLLSNSTNDSGKFQPNNSRIDNWSVYVNSIVYMTQGQQYTVHADASDGLVWSGTHNPNVTSNNVVLWLTDNAKYSVIISDANTGTGTTFTWNYPSGTYYLRVNTYKTDNSGYVEKVMLEEGTVAHTWSPAPDDLQTQFTQINTSIGGVTTTINDPKTGLNAIYKTAAGNATTISNVKSDVAQLETTATGLTSRVGNLESKTNTQETAIEQNKTAIALKADQTEVDNVKGTVTGLQSSLTVQGNQIQAKVSASDVTGMLTGYATQTYAQTLVTQTANNWNVNLTNLKTDVNAIKTTGGGVNLLSGTKDFSGWNVVKGNVSTSYNGSGTINYSGTVTSGQTEPILQYGFPNYVLKADTYYTLSFRAAMGNGGWLTTYVYGGDNGTNVSGEDTGYPTDNAHRWNISTSGQLYTYTFKTRKDLTAGNHALLFRNDFNSSGGSTNTITNLVLDSIMLEEGTVAHTWAPAPSDMATVTSVTNLSATVDGIKGTVATKADQSTVTQLSNVVQSKVSSSDYTSTINQLNNAINQRVQVGNVISQINQEAGGDTLIQVSNGKKSLILDAANTIITGEAWIPSAAISSISADKIMLGSTSLWNSDGTLNLVNSKDGINSKITVTQGSVNFDGTNKTASIIQFASDNNTNAFTVNPTGATVTPTLFFERFDQTPGHWLGFTRNETEHEGVMFHTWDDSAERFFVDCHARFDKNLRTIGTLSQGSWDGTNGKPEAGVLTIKSGNTIWSGSDYLAIGTNLTGSYGNVMARSFSQQSTLSSKTNIETVDPKDALDLVNRTDIRSYQYKSDVAQGHTKRYTSLIIDDVNDVSEYYAPNEFTNEERTGRDDGSAVGYLFLAVQELTKRIKTLEDKLNG